MRKRETYIYLPQMSKGGLYPDTKPRYQLNIRKVSWGDLKIFTTSYEASQTIISGIKKL